MFIKCRAFFEANSHDQIGFYGPRNQPQRRIKNGQEFQFEYVEDAKGNLPPIIEKEFTIFDTDEKGHEVNHRDVTKQMIGSWIEVLEMPRKKPGPKPKDEQRQELLTA